MGDVGIELWVVLIEFGVVFIGGWGYLTLPAFLKMKRPASIWGGIRKNNDLKMTLCCHG